MTNNTIFIILIIIMIMVALVILRTPTIDDISLLLESYEFAVTE
jgi:hypothetical protein